MKSDVECARRGMLFHPHHNWFLMYAHQEADIQRALDVADEAFGVVKEEFGHLVGVRRDILPGG